MAHFQPSAVPHLPHARPCASHPHTPTPQGSAPALADTNVDHVLVYQDDAQAWRWSALGGNGEIVAQGESHTRPEDATRAARGVFGQSVRVLEAEVSFAEPESSRPVGPDKRGVSGPQSPTGER